MDTLSRIIKYAAMGFLRISYPDCRVLDMNDMFYLMLKQKYPEVGSVSDILGRNIYVILNMKTDDVCCRSISEVIKCADTGKSYSDVDKILFNEEERYFKFICQPVYKPNGGIQELTVICFDITEEVKEKIRAEELLKIEEEFFINTTHEIKTPLNVIFGINQLLDMYISKDSLNKNKEHIKRNNNIIKQNCYRLIKLINNTIDLSKIESGHLKLNLTNTDIVHLICDIVQSVSEYVNDIGLKIAFDTDVKEKILAVDVDKIERIILNLISNAIKFSEKGSKIDIVLRDKGDFTEISVRDYGVGIEPDYLEAIFKRFEQAENTYSSNKLGSGVGLSLVKSIVEMHNGEISVESQVGKGSTFTIKLPSMIVDKPVTSKPVNYSDSKIEKINIEFSDIYSIN
ncbi:MAG TPA: hypothetical protein DCM73_12020 [Clostridiales bacterium]|nr:hypothetical protein [Clostridiales bacterium]